MPEETAVPVAQRPFSTAAAISNQLVRLFARYFGRGPTKARTTLNTNVALVTLADTMTRAEENLVAAGDAEAVRSMRRTLQRTMRQEAVEAVEQLLGRRVTAYMADIDTDANIAVVVFILEARHETGSVEVAESAGAN
jgi:uncharacterized protein YbcI